MSSNQEPAGSSKDRRIRSPNTRRRDSSVRDPASFATPFTSSSSSSSTGRLFARLSFSRRFGFETRSTFSVMGYQTLLADTNTLLDGLFHWKNGISCHAGWNLLEVLQEQNHRRIMYIYVGTKYESRRNSSDIRYGTIHGVRILIFYIRSENAISELSL